jgi:hypothetical protein
MMNLDPNRLFFRFPDVHEDAVCEINFQRTLRLPDDDRDHFLPPGLGSFPLRHVDDFADRLPPNWRERGGVFLPIHQAEAMWIDFSSHDYPFAVKVAAGKINAVTGEPWVPSLNRDPQDYVALPRQPWLDGFCVEEGTVRQFVAAHLGEGATAEEQITGAAETGGLQVMVYPMKAERYEEMRKKRERFGQSLSEHSEMMFCARSASIAPDMGMAPGGRMRQEIYDDEYGLDAWDQRHGQRCFVAMADALLWEAITGEPPQTRPPGVRAYDRAGLPWFDYYDDSAAALHGAEKLRRLKSIRETILRHGQEPDDQVRHIGPAQRPRA